MRFEVKHIPESVTQCKYFIDRYYGRDTNGVTIAGFITRAVADECCKFWNDKYGDKQTKPDNKLDDLVKVTNKLKSLYYVDHARLVDLENKVHNLMVRARDAFK